MSEGLESIDRSGLPGKLKLWCLQYGLMPRIMWPLALYEVAMSHVEAMECKINKHVKKWLGVPNSLSNVAIHSSKAKLTLPVRSLVEEVKVAKARSFMTLRDSQDPVVKNTQPEVRSGRKWTASSAVEEAESRLSTKRWLVLPTQAVKGLDGQLTIGGPLQWTGKVEGWLHRK